MVFSSLIFIFRFLPIFFIGYFLAPKKFKNLFLLIGSLIFYSWGEGKYFILMVLSIIVDYTISRLMEKLNQKNFRNFLLIFSITFNLGMLFIFKYLNFILENLNIFFNTEITLVNITLPLGISFYTFQTMSYTIDVYRGKVKAEKNIINFGAFVSMFPQLIAGPIVKYTDISKDLKKRSIDKNSIEKGITIFILGLGQKVIIANNIGLLWNEVISMDYATMPTILAWLGILSFSLQIYFDFSGYSLMAMGLGNMIGFKFPKNFNYPYIARSISEFWRRWHITLGSWFKEYVYIPLGGNKVGSLRLFFNLFIVWILTGVWHGAEYNFILWGIYFFILIGIEKLFLENFLKKYCIISHIYTIIFLLIGWLIFSMENLQNGLLYLKNLFIYMPGEWEYYFRNYMVILGIGIVFSTPIVKKYYDYYIKNELLRTIILMIIFFISVAYLVDSSYNPFLYFRF